MRVKTKYGLGTLVGVSTDNNGKFGYKVLLDNIFPSDIPNDEKKFNEIKKCEDRIYHCSYVMVLSDDGKEVTLSNGFFN